MCVLIGFTISWKFIRVKVQIQMFIAYFFSYASDVVLSCDVVAGAAGDFA